MNPNLPLVLCFGLDSKQASALRVLCVKFGMQYISVKEAQYGETIGVLAGLDAPQNVPYTEDCALAEPMLVFCNLTTQQISSFLGEARRAKFARPSLMAAFTETNRVWTPAALQKQLAEERVMMQTRMKSIHEGHEHTHTHKHTEEQKPEK
ncbi:MAG: DUF3783 domain-containing protein [Clostridia bacterium]|nr:DUF3783 domain-containing protein [Clostridia bacterium]